MDGQPNHDGLVNNCPEFHLHASQHSQGSWDPPTTPFLSLQRSIAYKMALRGRERTRHPAQFCAQGSQP